MHILNGSFYINELQTDPLHTVGHSLLTDATYVNLPGGNGQVVAMSLASSSNQDDTDDIEEHVTFASGNFTGLATTGRIDEGENVDTFIVIQPIQVGSFSIQPINRAMTIPRGPLATLKQLGNYKQFIKLLESQNDALAASIDEMRSVTIFGPTDEAIDRFQNDKFNLSSSDINTILRNHLVASRAVYSPLLQDQGSMVTMAGQDIIFDQTSSKLIVGNFQANVTQFDIIHRGGDIHTIDTVLADVELNPSAASQAAQSAARSAISGVAGPISESNAASSQGTDVPASEQSIAGQTNKNSTTLTLGAASANNTSSGGPSLSVSSNSAVEHHTITGTAGMIILLVTVSWLLI